LSTIERKLAGFGKTPRADPHILSSQEDDPRANSVRLEGVGQMRNIRLRVARKRAQMLSSDRAFRGADDVKTIVRDALLLMTWAEQVEFIQALETEMRRQNLSITEYLIPLGIPGMRPEELTPTEVGHLVSFLKMQVLKAVTAVERAMARLEVLREKEDPGHALAA
jgi:hypothetical protein